MLRTYHIAVCLFGIFSLITSSFLCAQTDSQLRDPEFLIERYNELAAKHNALIEKTKVLVQSRSVAQTPTISPDTEVLLKNELNEALAKVAAWSQGC